ncbi:hypothetical protein C8Q75DRAFT_767793 [Abortiporus biennis]|nr:hypothetical protein C8Q75DRAFT_767793 [Abortiporus biennis]
MSSRSGIRTRKSSSQLDITPEKENSNLNGSSSKTTTRKKGATSKARAPKVYCTCRGSNDGSPMILCSGCNEWYHFRCIDLAEKDAEEIQLYVCPACSEKTGLHSVMEWEGPEAMEKRPSITRQVSEGPSEKDTSTLIADDPEDKHGMMDDHGESTDGGSEDEYVEEEIKVKGKRRAHLSVDPDDDSDEDVKPKGLKRLRRGSVASKEHHKTSKKSSSPGPSHGLKRKQSSASSQPPQSKRTRSESTSGEDAARKYCSSKLQEMFSQIFLRYPILAGETIADEQDVQPSKKPEELTPEEKEFVEGKGKDFATELEHCMWELYAEPDATGKPSAGKKYKDEFRMLSFNLSKPDRVILHKRIVAARLTPKELSTMSSTDLANEETKHAIKQAEQESLAHSILKKATLPRAKMTHKGIQDIEDVNGAAAREEREREEEEEERIERERQERVRLQALRVQAAKQGSIPPDSPVVVQTPTWGGPPPLPPHALHPHDPGPSNIASPTRPPDNPLFVQTASELTTPAVEGELNLADLINIDDEPGPDALSTPVTSSIIPPLSIDTTPSASQSPSVQSPPPPVHTTGISPFAAKPSPSDATRRPSFDLNSLWTLKEEESQSQQEQPLFTEEPVQDSDMIHDETKEPQHVDVEMLGEAADDMDFDMLLGKDEDKNSTPPPPKVEGPEAEQARFDALPNIWTGKMSMPLDSTIPQEVSLVARQVGGRTLGGGSPLWHTLFPTEVLRIDGRVPVANSAQYLTQMRLNPAKELIAAAFSPDSEGSKAGFDALSNHLINKVRHGLIFPWGNRPKDWHPGRELYVIPLQATEPLPEYMELLDSLQLPKVRKSNHLVGIWVLNKGKLVPPPTLPAPPPAPVPGPSTSVPTSESPTASSINLTQLLSQLPNLSAAAQAASMGTPTHQPLPAAVAAEVATLTPEQIQVMLRTLSASAGTPPLPASTTIPVPLPVPQPLSSTPPQVHWNNTLPPSTAYPAFGPPVGPGMHGGPPVSMPPGKPYPPYNGYEQDRYPPNESYGGYDRPGNRGHERDRGGRGRGGGGSGGRGRNRGSDFERPRDAGWKSRGGGGGGRGRGRDRERGNNNWRDNERW